MSIPIGTKIDVWGMFTSSKLVKTGISSTVDVYTVDSSNVTVKVVDNQGALATGDKYKYTYTIVDENIVSAHATFKTEDGTVDQKEVGSLALSLNDPSASEISDVIWGATLRTLTELDLDGISDSIYDILLEYMSPYGHMIIGRGRGSQTYTDVLTDGRNFKIKYIVKAYSRVGDVMDWSITLGMDITDGVGSFTLFLDPGEYILSIEKNGIQIDTSNILVEI